MHSVVCWGGQVWIKGDQPAELGVSHSIRNPLSPLAVQGKWDFCPGKRILFSVWEMELPIGRIWNAISFMLQRVRGGVFKAGETGPKSELVLGDWVEQFPPPLPPPNSCLPGTCECDVIRKVGLCSCNTLKWDNTGVGWALNPIHLMSL